MPIMQQQIDDLTARLERIEKWPRLKAYLEGRLELGPYEGIVQHVDEWALANPKSQPLLDAEVAVETAQAERDAANRALFEASRQPAGRFISEDAYGEKIVVDVPADSLVQSRTDIPEFLVLRAAEEKLINARRKLYKLERQRDAERQAWELKRNPILNPSKQEKTSNWSRLRRIG